MISNKSQRNHQGNDHDAKEMMSVPLLNAPSGALLLNTSAEGSTPAKVPKRRKNTAFPTSASPHLQASSAARPSGAPAVAPASPKRKRANTAFAPKCGSSDSSAVTLSGRLGRSQEGAETVDDGNNKIEVQEEEEDDHYSDDHLIRMTILSRVVERYRFLIPEENVDDLVDEDSLCWMFELDLDLPQRSNNNSKSPSANSRSPLQRNASFDSTFRSDEGGYNLAATQSLGGFTFANADAHRDEDDDGEIAGPIPKSRGNGWSRVAARFQLGRFAQQHRRGGEGGTEGRENEDEKTSTCHSDEGRQRRRRRRRRRKVTKTVLDAMDNLVQVEVSESDTGDDVNNDSDTALNSDDNNNINATNEKVVKTSISPPKSALKSPPSGAARKSASKWKNLKDLPLPSSLTYKKQHQQQLDQNKRKSRLQFADVVFALMRERNNVDRKNGAEDDDDEADGDDGTNSSRAKKKNRRSSRGGGDEDQNDQTGDTAKPSLAGAAGRFALLKITVAVSAIGEMTFGAVKSVKNNVRDSVHEIKTGVIAVASDLGILKKTQPRSDARQLASSLWRHCGFSSGDDINGRRIVVSATFRELLEFDLSHFPYTSFKQREILRRFEDQSMVSRAEVAMELGFELDDPVLTCIFGKLQELPGICYDRLVSCVHEHPHKHCFAHTCARQIEQAKTNMSLVFASIIMLLVTLIVVPQLDVSTMFRLQRSSLDLTGGEFPNRCKNGNVTDPNSCFFIKRTLDDVRTSAEVTTYFREFIATEMWPDDDVTKGSEDSFFGNVRVGAMMMKTSPLVSSASRKVKGAYDAAAAKNPAVACPLRSCGSLNLSQDIYEFQISTFFSCDAFDRENSVVVIPFNTSRPEALAMAQKFEPSYCVDEDVMVTLQYAMYQPSQQVLSWTTVSFTVPRAGSVIPRSYTGTMNLNAKGLVRAFAGIHMSIFLWLLLIVTLRRGEGAKRFFSWHMLSEYLLTSLNIASLTMIESLPPIDEILQMVVQADYVPRSLDGYVATYNTAVDILAWWTLIFFVFSCQIFSHFIGLNVITRLLKVTASDVTVLLVLFTVIASSFLGVARVLFGSACAEFSYSPTTVLYLLKFLWGAWDFSVVTKQAPVAGAVFFFAFLAFVIIFVLNLLIAVITARLEDMRARANLHLELYSQISNDASNFEGTERWWWNFRQMVLPVVNIVVDATPFIASTLRWKEFHRMMRELCSPYTRRSLPPIQDIVQNSIELLLFMDKASPANFEHDDEYWNTALRRSVDTYEPISDRASWALIERVILCQSQYDVVRDAALIRVLISYDETSTDIEKVISYQNEQENLCVKDLERLAAGVSIRQKKFADAYFNNNNNNNNSNNNSKTSAHVSFNLEQHHNKQPAAASCQSETRSVSPPPSEVAAEIFFAARPSSSSSPLLPPPSPSKFGQTATEAATSSSDFARRIFQQDNRHIQLEGDKQKKKKSHTGFRVSAKKQRFWHNQYILRQVKSYLYFPVRSVLSLALYLAFFLSLLLYDESSSWLGQNLQQGLANFPFVQNCYDQNCTRAFTIDSRFSDVGNLEDIQEYIRKLFVPKIFPFLLPYDPATGLSSSSSSSSSDSSSNSSSSSPEVRMFAAETGEEMFHVYWDTNIRRVGPVTVRQLLGGRQPCTLPSKSTLEAYGDPTRAKLFESLECYTPSGIFSSTFDDTPMLRPANSELPNEAYIFQNNCVEQQTIQGSFDYFPCSGFSAKAHNASQMLYIQEWLNPAAKLVVISSTFRAPKRSQVAALVRQSQQGHSAAVSSSSSSSSSTITVLSSLADAESAEVRIDLYIEMAPGGGGGLVWSYNNIADQPMFRRYAWLGFLNLGIDLAFFLFHLARYTYYRRTRNKLNPKSAEQHRPEAPLINIVILAACIWLAASSGVQRQLRESWMLAVLVISSTSMLMNNFVFPVAKMITYRALTLIRSLTLAMKLVLVIIPFYAVVTVGFVYSGHLMFGRCVLEYSTLLLSLQTIGRGLLTDWNIENMYSQRPLLTLFFCIAFFAVILVVLANLLLTLITAAVDEAKRETKIVTFVQMAAEFSNQKVYTDEYVSTRLAWHLADDHVFLRLARNVEKFLKRKFGTGNSESNDNQSQPNKGGAKSQISTSLSRATKDSRDELEAVTKLDKRGGQFFVSGAGRFARPLESLMFVCTPFQLQELAETLHLAEVSEEFIFSVSLFLARSHMDFVKKFPDQFTLDDAEGSRLMSGFRAACAANTPWIEDDEDNEDDETVKVESTINTEKEKNPASPNVLSKGNDGTKYNGNGEKKFTALRDDGPTVVGLITPTKQELRPERRNRKPLVDKSILDDI